MFYGKINFYFNSVLLSKKKKNKEIQYSIINGWNFIYYKNTLFKEKDRFILLAKTILIYVVDALIYSVLMLMNAKKNKKMNYPLLNNITQKWNIFHIYYHIYLIYECIKELNQTILFYIKINKK